MSSTFPTLEQIRIASPCHVRWDQMSGDEKSRHCASCNLRVHNLSAMTRAEAEALVAGRTGEGRMCVRLYKRADGTVITQDCPVGLAAARLRVRRVVARLAAAFGLMGGAAVAGTVTARASSHGPLRLRPLEPIGRLATALLPSQPELPESAQVEIIMGDFCPVGPSDSGGDIPLK